jgi:hypothetical protein
VFRIALVLLFSCASAACAHVAPEPAFITPTVIISAHEVTAGSPFEMRYAFAVAANAPALDPDTWVFVHFLDDTGEVIWTDDHQPPTAADRWTAGSTVQYTRTLFVPDVLYIGEMSVEVGLYVPKTGTRLPLSGADDSLRALRAGTLDLRLQTRSPLVTFANGWYPAEGPTGGPDPQWRWSRGAATLSFRNPRHDIVLVLDTDEPIATGAMRTGSVLLGPNRLASFPLTPHRREITRVPIAGKQLGTADMVEVTLRVDRTFIPARVAPPSGDTRILGLRVFHAYVQLR